MARNCIVSLRPATTAPRCLPGCESGHLHAAPGSARDTGPWSACDARLPPQETLVLFRCRAPGTKVTAALAARTARASVRQASPRSAPRAQRPGGGRRCLPYAHQVSGVKAGPQGRLSPAAPFAAGKKMRSSLETGGAALHNQRAQPGHQPQPCRRHHRLRHHQAREPLRLRQEPSFRSGQPGTISRAGPPDPRGPVSAQTAAWPATAAAPPGSPPGQADQPGFPGSRLRHHPGGIESGGPACRLRRPAPCATRPALAVRGVTEVTSAT